MKKNAAAALFFLIAGGLCFAQSDQQPSLAELAKKNKAEKKAVLSVNQDTPYALSGRVSVVGDESSKPAPPAESSTSKKAGDNNQTASSKDSSEIAELKKKMDSYREQQDGWKRSAKHYEDLLTSETDDFRRETYQTALENDRVNVGIFQKKIDQAQADLTKAQQAAAATNNSPGQTPAKAGPAGQQ